jgi:hypothetical protein
MPSPHTHPPQSRPTCRPSDRRGVAFVYALVVLVVMLAFCSLGVDYGRVQLVKTELQRGADAAVRAAAAQLANGIPAAQNAAVSLAAANKSDEQPITVDANLDVEFGSWDSGTKSFTVLSGASRSNANAVRVTCRRIASRNNAVPLMFARVIGRNTCDVSASAVALAARGAREAGFVALWGAVIKKNFFLASYNSNLGTDPGGYLNASPTSRWNNGNWNGNHNFNQTGSYGGGNYEYATNPGNPDDPAFGDKASFGTNGWLSVTSDATLEGDIILGPQAKFSYGRKIQKSGYERLTSAIPTPPDPDTTPSANPNGLPYDYTFTGNVTLPGGNYYFTSFKSTSNAVLTFTGPATLRLNGDADFGNSTTIRAYRDKPANLQIYQAGIHQFGGGDTNTDITAVITAPKAILNMRNDFTLRGAATFSAMTVGSNAVFLYDETLGPSGAVAAISVVN